MSTCTGCVRIFISTCGRFFKIANSFACVARIPLVSVFSVQMKLVAFEKPNDASASEQSIFSENQGYKNCESVSIDLYFEV